MKNDFDLNHKDNQNKRIDELMKLIILICMKYMKTKIVI